MMVNGWGGGVGLGYFSGKLSDLHRKIETSDSSAPELDVSGITLRFSGTKYF